MKRKCIKCNLDKDDEYFYKGRNVCKVCMNEYSKQYKIDNNDKIKQKEEEYRNSHKEYYLEYMRNYRKEHRQYFIDYSKNYREKNKNYFKNYYIVSTLDIDDEIFKNIN